MTVSADQLSLRRLPVAADAGLPQRFSFALGPATYDVAVYAQIELGTVNTTASTQVLPGMRTISPASMTGIDIGTVLIVGSGSDQEQVVVSAAGTRAFAAKFRRTHGPSLYAIRSAASRLDPPQTVYDLAPSTPTAEPTAPPGFLVLRVARAGNPAQPIFLGKAVVDTALVHEAAELGLVVKRARVARGNLNGSGHYGTDIAIGVGRLWA